MKKKILSKILVAILSLSLAVGSANLLAWGEGQSLSTKSCNTSTYSLKKLGIAVAACALVFACVKSPVQNTIKDYAIDKQKLQIEEKLSNKNKIIKFDIHREISENFHHESIFLYRRLLEFYVEQKDKESFRELLRIILKNEVDSENSSLRGTYVKLLLSAKTETFLKILMEELNENNFTHFFYIYVGDITYLHDQKEYFNLDLIIKNAIAHHSGERLLIDLLDIKRPDVFIYFIHKINRKLEPSTVDKIVYIGNQKFVDEAFKHIDFSIAFKANDQFPLEGIAKYDLDQSFVFLDQKGIFSEEFLFETFLSQVAYYNSHQVLKRFLDRYANNADKNQIYEKVLFSLMKQATYLNPSILEILESYSVDLHLYEEDLLYDAVRSGNVELTKWMIKKGFKFEEK